MKYEVNYTIGDDDENFGADEMADEIRAFYMDAAERGGRVVGNHTLTLSGGEYLFFVAEFPDEADSPA
jgi:hypothetical protein